ncbi:MAG: tRNA pseudouridine(13) synthase TruD [Plesiomonas sp.]|uniref:tRNA pseudouridine(13) synthase TruD n=1 Tax=Plesiomonas sp. TaxID=2486279 RepID=UPI003F3AAB7D
MESTSVSELHYLHGKPTHYAQLKAQPDDFCVIENLGYDFTGEGEHVMVLVRKISCNTKFVAEKLAEYAGIPARNVTYAGLKDRHAVTEQWFGLHIPGKITPDFSAFQLDGCTVLNITRHNRKMRTGALRGNQFEILLRGMTASTEHDVRLTLIAEQGVPNYFGEQRFGREGNNLHLARRWASGEVKVKDRNKRSFCLSAARSELFNLVVSARIAANLHTTVLLGDALQLAGRNSWFVTTPEELTQSQQRLQERDVNLTAPMVGEGELGSQAEAATFEQIQLDTEQALIHLLTRERLESMRRALLLRPERFTWQWQPEGLKLAFFLPAGSYATSVIREIVLTDQEGDNRAYPAE